MICKPKELPLPPAKTRKSNPKRVGESSEAYIIARFLELGYNVLEPWGDNARYDLVIDIDGVFYTVQCKTAYPAPKCKHSVRFNTTSDGGTKRQRGYKKDIDFFAVYCPTNYEVYVIPVDHVGKRQFHLNLEPIDPEEKKSNYKNYAERYLLKKQVRRFNKKK